MGLGMHLEPLDSGSMVPIVLDFFLTRLSLVRQVSLSGVDRVSLSTNICYNKLIPHRYTFRLSDS